MNKREAAVISAYTGVLLGDFSEMCKYVEQIMERPIWTHQYADKNFVNEIKQKAKKDFCNLIITNADGTPAESRYGRELEKSKDCDKACDDCSKHPLCIYKAPKPLAQYLDEYIEHETGMECHYGTWRELFEQALDAYESTEQVKIRIGRV